MKVLLDTNICIYLIKRRPQEVRERFERYAVGEVGLSSITVSELQYGVEKSRRVEQNRAALMQFLLPLVIADFDYESAVVYGRVRAELERLGTPMGPLDTLIAAHALSLDVTLVTNNEREFSRVSDLRVENWVS
ncbi:MAG: type II toxin-antitoxin system VapC family toxin [Bacteroidetes bacterium]|nr:type II toxin-antitoxin system VapC family toxin [Bacteroidota bacterium]